MTWNNPKYNTPYFTQYWYPRLELDDHLVSVGKKYFRQWNKKLNLPLGLNITSPLKERTYGMYKPIWRIYNFKEPFGEIYIDVEKHKDEEELFDTIHHELAHAICDIRHNMSNHDNACHCQKWIRLAKLMRVDVKRYEHKHC